MTKDNLATAEHFISRWAWLSRKGLPDIGYKHKSPEQPPDVAEEYGDYEILPEDELTEQSIAAMSLQLKNIARLYWSRGMKPKEIGQRESISPRQVRLRIHKIRHTVALDVVV